MRTIRTSEHSRRTIHEGLELRPGDTGLVEKLTKSNMLEIKELRSGVEISSFSHVGMARFENFEVVVDPKIKLEPQNLPRLFAYAFEFDDIRMQDGEAGVTPRYDWLVDVLIDFFVRECRRLIAMGLLKSYVTYRDDVSFLRGRILVQRQLGHIAKREPVFACEFDELEYDNLENRILLYCLGRCHDITGSSRLRKETRMLVRQLAGVVRRAEISLEDIDGVAYTRLNQHYRKLHALARLIISSTGVGHLSGPNTVRSFFVDMNEVFERFVARLFEEHHPCEAEFQKSRHAWSTEEGGKKYIRTDILLDSKLVVDSKYKKELSPGDLYQIGFYIHEYRQKQGYAILPECAGAQEDDIISERERITVSVRTINVDDALRLLYAKEHEKLQEMVLGMVPVG